MPQLISVLIDQDITLVEVLVGGFYLAGQSQASWFPVLVVVIVLLSKRSFIVYVLEKATVKDDNPLYDVRYKGREFGDTCHWTNNISSVLLAPCRMN